MVDDDIFYQQVADELSRREMDPALMAKATGKSLGDKDLAKSLYIELRVHKLEEELAARLAAEAAARRAEEAAAKEAQSKQEFKEALKRQQEATVKVLAVVAVFILFCLIVWAISGQ